MSTKKFFEFKLSRIQALVSLLAFMGFIVSVFILGAFTGRKFFQTPGTPPARQNLLPDNSVADYGAFESLNTAPAASTKTASQFSFYETLPKNGESFPPPSKDQARSKTVPPLSSTTTAGLTKQPDSPFRATAYTIQIAAFRQREKAYALADKLTKQGYRPQVSSTTNEKGDTWHRVRVGRYNTPEEAKRLLPSLSEISSQPQIIAAEE